jgi:hypothetical protein
MRVLIVVAVPLYLVWLVQVGYLVGQRLPDGDTTWWAPVALPSAAMVFCVAAERSDTLRLSVTGAVGPRGLGVDHDAPLPGRGPARWLRS